MSASTEQVDARSASVQVAVRLRPMNSKEEARDTLPVVTANSAKSEVTLIRGSAQRQQRQTYSFDSVFGSFSEQREVFDSVRPLVDDVMHGYEATVRALHTPRTLIQNIKRRPPRRAALFFVCTGLRVRPDRHRQDLHDGGRPQGRAPEGRHPARRRRFI